MLPSLKRALRCRNNEPMGRIIMGSFFSTNHTKKPVGRPRKSKAIPDEPLNNPTNEKRQRHNRNTPSIEEIRNVLKSVTPLTAPDGTNGTTTTTKPTTTTTRSMLEDVERMMQELPRLHHREPPPSQRTQHQRQRPSVVSMANSSIFEMFQIPEPPPPRAPNAFPSKAWDQYETILTQVLEKRDKEDETRQQQQQQPSRQRNKKQKPLHASLREWLYCDTPAVSVSLPLLEHRLQKGHDEDETSDTNSSSTHQDHPFRHEIQQQQQTFATAFHVTPAHIQAAQGVLYQVSCQCARKGWGWAVQVLRQKIKEAGMTNDTLLHNVLYLSSLQQKIRKQDDAASFLLLHAFDNDEDDTNDVMNEMAWYHDLLYQPVAQSIQARVQWFVEHAQAAAAERWLDRFNHEEVRLRVYTPILKLYLEQGEFEEAIRLYRHMRHTLPLVHFQVETYWLLLSTLASEGYFAYREDGPALFHSIVQEMADDPNVMELPLNAAIRLRNALADHYDGLTRTSALQPLPLITTEFIAPTLSPHRIVAERVQIDGTVGKCPVTNTQLRLLRLTLEQRKELRLRMLDLAQDNQRQYAPPNQSSSKQQKEQIMTGKTDDDPLLDFMTFLQQRRGPPFTIIVDGANVGYYMQNFQEGRFSFHQIQWMMDDLQRRGEHALVVLPQKYMRDEFYISIGVGGFDQRRSQRQVLTEEEKEIRDRLVAQKQVYVVQPGSLDDFYWITASVTDQTNAIATTSASTTAGDELWVLPDDSQGRWPGARPLLISNDRMRDHKLSMMEPQLFRRWFSNYMVNYSFLAYVNGTSRARSDIHFLAADAYSREIQSNSLEDGRIAWHFPLQDTTDEWFCVVLPHRKE